MIETNGDVRSDQHGALRVGESRVMLDSILAAWGDGHSPEAICQQYPSLSLREIYGAISWSLSHPDEVADYLKSQNAVWEHWRRRSEENPSPLRARVRSAKPQSETR